MTVVQRKLSVSSAFKNPLPCLKIGKSDTYDIVYARELNPLGPSCTGVCLGETLIGRVQELIRLDWWLQGRCLPLTNLMCHLHCHCSEMDGFMLIVLITSLPGPDPVYSWVDFLSVLVKECHVARADYNGDREIRLCHLASWVGLCSCFQWPVCLVWTWSFTRSLIHLEHCWQWHFTAFTLSLSQIEVLNELQKIILVIMLWSTLLLLWVF